MAKEVNQGIATPESVTLQMAEMLKEELKDYSGYSNAYLATIEYVEGPIWVMDLYNGKYTHHAILEETPAPGSARLLYIYAGEFKPHGIIDMGQTYQRQILCDGVVKFQIGQVFSNEKLEPCIKWKTIA